MDTVPLPDGRRAQLLDVGSASGPVVLVCHGTPDTRWVARTGVAAAAALGVRLVCVNRPGYGGSSPAATTLDSVAADSVAVLDALGLDRVAVLGMSVGGLYAAALAAHAPDRVSAFALVATPREEPRELTPGEFEAWAAGADVADPSDASVAARWLGSLPPDDAALLAAALSTAEVAASAREALADHAGYLADAELLVEPWRLRFADVACPVRVWSGAHDERNPPAAGAWWAERLPRAELTVTPTSHLATLLANWEPVLRDLGGRGGGECYR